MTAQALLCTLYRFYLAKARYSPGMKKAPFGLAFGSTAPRWQKPVRTIAKSPGNSTTALQLEVQLSHLSSPSIIAYIYFR